MKLVPVLNLITCHVLGTCCDLMEMDCGVTMPFGTALHGHEARYIYSMTKQ